MWVSNPNGIDFQVDRGTSAEPRIPRLEDRRLYAGEVESASMNALGPSLSLGERDRRWRAIRDLMQHHGLDCLVLGAFRGRLHFESYIIDDQLDCEIVFPLEGPPTVLTWNTVRISRAQTSEARGVELWTSSYRVGGGAA